MHRIKRIIYLILLYQCLYFLFSTVFLESDGVELNQGRAHISVTISTHMV